MPEGPIALGELAAIDVERLSGVGPKKLSALRAMGLATALDLLSHYPRRYVDRTREGRIADLEPGEEAMVVARVGSISSRRVRGNRSMITAEVSDGSGRLRVSFFNQAWRERQLPAGTEAVFFGRLEVFRGTRQMTNPVVDLIGNRTGRILPVYPQSEKSGLSTWEIGDLAAQVLRRCSVRGLADPVPPGIRERFGLVDRSTAYAAIHAPESMAQMVEARKRLVPGEGRGAIPAPWLRGAHSAFSARKPRRNSREMRSHLSLIHI